MDEKADGAKSSQASATSTLPSSADKTRMTEQIGRQLRGMYDGLLNQPVPDRFMDLVKQLQQGDQDTDRRR